MTDNDFNMLETYCRKIHESVGRSWAWDGRFYAALLTFLKPDEDSIIKIASAQLNHVWTSQTLNESPDIIQFFVQDVGGLQSGQLFMHTDVQKAIFLFGAVWPWRDGKTISLRVGSSNKSEHSQNLKDCFKIT